MDDDDDDNDDELEVDLEVESHALNDSARVRLSRRFRRMSFGSCDTSPRSATPSPSSFCCAQCGLTMMRWPTTADKATEAFHTRVCSSLRKIEQQRGHERTLSVSTAVRGVRIESPRDRVERALLCASPLDEVSGDVIAGALCIVNDEELENETLETLKPRNGDGATRVLTERLRNEHTAASVHLGDEHPVTHIRKSHVLLHVRNEVTPHQSAMCSAETSYDLLCAPGSQRGMQSSGASFTVERAQQEAVLASRCYWRLQTLTSIVLRDAQLSVLPEALSHVCRALQVLDLGDNHFEHIPAPASRSIELRVLKLARNRLSGTLPSDSPLFDMRWLEHLDVCCNSLCALPDDRMALSLPRLHTLDASGNALTEPPSALLRTCSSINVQHNRPSLHSWAISARVNAPASLLLYA